MLCVLVSRIDNMSRIDYEYDKVSSTQSIWGQLLTGNESMLLSVKVNWAEDDAQAESRKFHFILFLIL